LIIAFALIGATVFFSCIAHCMIFWGRRRQAKAAKAYGILGIEMSSREMTSSRVSEDTSSRVDEETSSQLSDEITTVLS
jgi:hypothetical protein